MLTCKSESFNNGLFPVNYVCVYSVAVVVIGVGKGGARGAVASPVSLKGGLSPPPFNSFMTLVSDN